MQFKRSLVSIVVSLSLVLFAVGLTSAQLRLPRPSQKATVIQTVGVTDVTITYSRPGVKGRPIFGEVAEKDNYAKGEGTLDDQYKRPEGMQIVPYGHVWRTGANEATQFVVTDDVLINGQKLSAGSYSLHTIPGKNEWTIVFNGAANQWGSFNYDPAKDTLRVKVKPQTVSESQEWLEYSFNPVADNSATVNIRWERVNVPFTVQVADIVGSTIAHAREAVNNAKPDDWRTPYQAAVYARDNKATEDASKWFDQAIKSLDASITAKETFQNLSAKSQVLFAAGKKDEAFAVADKAVARGKADKVDTAAFEKRIADLKAGKM